jgi:WhiB family redox-sensing transcriptional regulator
MDSHDWVLRARCREEPTDTFFPDTRNRGVSHDRALALCQECPVRAECLDFAVSNGEKYGIWGGTVPHERRKLRRAWLKANLRCEDCSAPVSVQRDGAGQQTRYCPPCGETRRLRSNAEYQRINVRHQSPTCPVCRAEYRPGRGSEGACSPLCAMVVRRRRRWGTRS